MQEISKKRLDKQKYRVYNKNRTVSFNTRFIIPFVYACTNKKGD